MKKFIALFLIFSLLSLSGNLYAKKRGSELIIQKKDGQAIKGELIAVKQKTLLLLDSGTGADVSVDINDIFVIEVARKSGAGIGFLIGGGLGVSMGLVNGDDTSGIIRISAEAKAIMWGLSMGLFGLLMGALITKDTKIQIEGKTKDEIALALFKLRKKARIRDYK